MKRFFMLLLPCIGAIIFYSCAEGRSMTSGANHQYNKDLIEREHKNCLASAQSAADSAACEDRYEKDMEKENERYENEKSVLKEIEACEESQKYIMEQWGYSKDEARKVANRLASRRSTENYSFDCREAVAELIKEGYKDKVAVSKFAEELPKFGLSSNGAENAAKVYYEEELYDLENLYGSKQHTFKNPAQGCINNNRFGNAIVVDERLLKKMELLEGDDDDDDDDDENGKGKKDGDGNNAGNGTEQTPPQDKGGVTQGNGSGNNTTTSDDYQTEANKISKTIISKYGFNKSTLSSEMRDTLDNVIAFLKKWPAAEVTIVGHTCNIGSNEQNNIVGARRAHEAKMYLISKGIDENRIGEVSKAAENPIADNNTEEGRQINRRISFIIK